MKFILLIYNEDAALDTLPPGRFDSMMKDCLTHADELRAEGHLIESQQLEGVKTAKTVRIRNDRQTVVDGPFTETKEVLGGFNIIEAADMDEAVRIAATFPWASTGSVEVRQVRDFSAVRAHFGVPEPAFMKTTS